MDLSHDQHSHHVLLPALSDNDLTYGPTIADAICHSPIVVIYARQCLFEGLAEAGATKLFPLYTNSNARYTRFLQIGTLIGWKLWVDKAGVSQPQGFSLLPNYQ